MKRVTSYAQAHFTPALATYIGGMETSVEIVEHPAEVRLRLRAPTLGALAAVAGGALAELEIGRRPEAGDGAWREIAIHARDREALLVHWLNELIYRAETDR